jgi:hypothetical protein
VSVKDLLFLMKPGFFNQGRGPFYCGDSVAVEGLLSYFPQLRNLLEVQYIGFERPRTPLVSLLGEAHQSLPVLVLAAGRRVEDASLEPLSATGRLFFSDEKAIRRYLSSQYSLPQAG